MTDCPVCGASGDCAHLEQRLAVALATEANKRRALELGQAVAPSPERAALAARAARMRDELAGFAALPPDVRDSEAVRRAMWPRIAQYAELRLALAADAVMAEVAAELGVSPSWIAQVGGGLARATRPATEPPPLPLPLPTA